MVTNGWAAIRLHAAASSDVVMIGCMEYETAAALDIGIALVSFRYEACGKAGLALRQHLLRRSYYPRTFGMWMNSHGLGKGPTGTSISVGPSRCAKACRNAWRNSPGFLARTASAPKLLPKATKSGLARSLPIRRLPKRSCWIRRTLP